MRKFFSFVLAIGWMLLLLHSNLEAVNGSGWYSFLFVLMFIITVLAMWDVIHRLNEEDD